MDQPLFQSSLIVQTKPESPSANNQKVKVTITMINKIKSLERVHQGTDNVDAKQTARRACQSTYFNFDATQQGTDNTGATCDSIVRRK